MNSAKCFFRWGLIAGLCLSTQVAGEPVKFLLMGDTQHTLDLNPLDDGKPQVFRDTMQNILTDPVTSNALCLIHMGDIVESDADNSDIPDQYLIAQEEFFNLDGKMPYVLCNGNNDPITQFNQFFPISRYNIWPSFVANREDHNNVAHTFSAGGVDWLIVTIQYGNPEDVSDIAWAEMTVKAHPDKKVILVTHAAAIDDEVGTLAKRCPNVVFVLGGHTDSTIELMNGLDGHPIGFVRTCWHNSDLDNYLGLLEIDTEKGTVSGKYYSPYYQDYGHDVGSALDLVTRNYHPWVWDGFDFDLTNRSDHASYVSQRVPDLIAPSATQAVSVTMNNSGTNTWAAVAGYKLGIDPSINVWMTNHYVELPHDVAPGEEVTFSFEIIAPADLGIRSFQWRMVKVGGPDPIWFGMVTPDTDINLAWVPVNLVKNPSVEEGTTAPTFWTVSTNYTRSSDQSYDGSYSAKGAGTGSIGSMTQTIPIQQNTDYTLSYRIRCVSGTGRVSIDTWDVFDSQGMHQNFTVPSDYWQTFTGTFNSGASNQVRLRVFTSPTFSGTFYVDDVRLYDPKVAASNSTPGFTSTPELIARVGDGYSYTVSVTDPEGDPVVLRGVIVPSWLSLNTNTSVLSGTPTRNDLGANDVTLRVSDLYSSADQQFTLWVETSGNDAPMITSTPVTGVTENNPYRYPVEAFDLDGDSLTYSAPILPSWLHFNPISRVLSGTPASTNTGLQWVALAVSDGIVTVTQQFNIAVFAIPVPINMVPNPSFESGSTGWSLTEMTISTNQATHGTNSLMVAGTGADAVRGTSRPTPEVGLQTNTAYELTYDINYVSGTGNHNVRFNNMNNGAHVKSTTSSPTSGWVTKTVSFNSGASNAVRMDLYVDGTPSTNCLIYVDHFVLAPAGAVGNTAPVITSIPVTNVAQGSVYNYILLAADAENADLTGLLLTTHSWLNFDTGTGVLRGTPSSTNVGPHAVSLRVSDGSLSVTQNFTIVVASSYDDWADEQGEVIGESLVDFDEDGRNNLYEYALNGNPTDDQDIGVDPDFVMTGSEMEYIHLQRRYDPNLSYTVETRTHLVSGGWTTAGYTVLGTNSYNEDYDQVRYAISTTNKNSYIRLKIQKQ